LKAGLGPDAGRINSSEVLCTLIVSPLFPSTVIPATSLRRSEVAGMTVVGIEEKTS
jgi:hypothetical protein